MVISLTYVGDPILLTHSKNGPHYVHPGLLLIPRHLKFHEVGTIYCSGRNISKCSGTVELMLLYPPVYTCIQFHWRITSITLQMSCGWWVRLITKSSQCGLWDGSHWKAGGERLVLLFKVVYGLLAVAPEKQIQRNQNNTRANNSLRL